MSAVRAVLDWDDVRMMETWVKLGDGAPGPTNVTGRLLENLTGFYPVGPPAPLSELPEHLVPTRDAPVLDALHRSHRLGMANWSKGNRHYAELSLQGRLLVNGAPYANRPVRLFNTYDAREVGLAEPKSLLEYAPGQLQGEVTNGEEAAWGLAVEPLPMIVTRTAADGSFRIDQLPKGWYALAVMLPGQVPGKVTLNGSGPVHLERSTDLGTIAVEVTP